MTAAAGNSPTFREVEIQMRALADAGVGAWRKDERVSPDLLVRIPQIANCAGLPAGSAPADSEKIWEVIEGFVRNAIGNLRSEDFGPAARDSFGMTDQSSKLTTVEDRDALAAKHIGPKGHGHRWYRSPYKPYGGMWPRYFVASQVGAALLGEPSPEQFVREARAREIANDPPAQDDGQPRPDLADLLDNLSLPAVPELIIAIARPIGTDTKPLISRLRHDLGSVNYLVATIKVSHLIQATAEAERGEGFSFGSEYERIRTLMEAGDQLRTMHGDGAATAALVVKAISTRRARLQMEADQARKRGVAYLVTNLMHPAEVTALRNTYHSRFFLIGVFENESVRQTQLRNLVKLPGDKDDKEAAVRAEELMDIDAGKLPASTRLTDGSLSLNKTFHLADLFVSSRGVRSEQTIERFVNQVFSHPFGTLTVEETAMGIAYLAAGRSSALARRVGAALLDESGSVIGVGWNDPVKKDGRCYEDGDEPDNREHKSGGDPSDPLRLDAIAYFLNTIAAEATWKDLDLAEIDAKVREQLATFSDRA